MQAFDYDHDSDAEWEVDENGEDVDSGDDSMEEDTSSTASDLDDWLIDDDDVTEDHPDSSTLTLNKKRKPAETSGVKSHNKKRRVVPLVPFQKGPIWEKHLGACEDDLFNQMRIQMFNGGQFCFLSFVRDLLFTQQDIPEPLNPFQYISISEAAKSGSEDDSQAANSTSEAFTSVALSNSPSNNLRVMDGCRTLKNKQNATSIPKTTFPDIHIETLLRKITTVNTNSFAVLVDTLYQDLKPMGIKKNALEVKLREVAEKDKEMKSWKVKETTWVGIFIQFVFFPDLLRRLNTNSIDSCMLNEPARQLIHTLYLTARTMTINYFFFMQIKIVIWLQGPRWVEIQSKRAKGTKERL